jgi:hypothetical protein
MRAMIYADCLQEILPVNIIRDAPLSPSSPSTLLTPFGTLRARLGGKRHGYQETTNLPVSMGPYSMVQWRVLTELRRACDAAAHEYRARTR